MEWLDENLKSEIKNLFEPRYGRSLQEDEVIEIAKNLVSYVEHFAKFTWKTKYE